MPNKSKAKGNRFEREIVEAVELHEIKVQAKVRKALPKWIRPSENVDVQIIKEDRGKMYVVQELNDWLVNLKK